MVPGGVNDAFMAPMAGTPDLRTIVAAPDDVRELVILHLARRMGNNDEWSHHLGPAGRGALSDEVIAPIATADDRPPSAGLSADQVAVWHAAAFDVTPEPGRPPQPGPLEPRSRRKGQRRNTARKM